MNTATQATYTADDLLLMPDGDLYELVDGQLVERTMGTESSWVGGQIVFMLAAFVQGKQLGWVLPADTSYQCFPTNHVRKPDVSFIRLGRLPNEELPRGHCRITPDLVVEVISPNDLYSDVLGKMLEYLEAGVRLVWLVDPDSRTVMTHSPERAQLLRETDELSGGEILPGFACTVRELFPPRATTERKTES